MRSGLYSVVLFAANLLAPAYAQDSPAKSIRIVVGFTAGTATDTMARIIGLKLNDSWKVPVVVENRSGYEAANWYGLVAAARTPAKVISKINTEISRILQMPDVRERLDVFGADVIAGSPEDLARRMKSGYAKWAALFPDQAAQAR